VLDFNYRAGAETHEFPRRLFKPNTHGETLRNTHPVQGAFYIGDGAWNVDTVLIDDAPAYALDYPFDRNFAVEH
jgi:hypothetical protein